ncbi:MAG: glycosidase [Candidatus Bathyarchaeota archaeon]|nr:glycosidase [Candidatus Bathyarchaeota archaeon]
MKRFEGNPILKPDGKHDWESRTVSNAAAILLDKQIHLLYRAMGNDNISRIGYAVTTDGYNIDERAPDPAFSPIMEAENAGCEDPRLTVLGDSLIMTYVAYGQYAYHKVYQVALTSIPITNFLARQWIWGERRLCMPGIRNKDAIVFPKKINDEYIMFLRFDPDICIARSNDLNLWYKLEFVMGPRLDSWDSFKVGATGLPIELNEGWLFIYHGVNYSNVYCLGVALLDKERPEQVIYRGKEPILTPEKDYERLGKVQNVVFSCGNVLIDDKVLVYYGGADSVLCVATYDLAELLPKK